MTTNDAPIDVPAELLALTCHARRIAVLSGAGMSAESGVPTFRDAQTGLWAEFDAETLATPEAFRRDRELVWAWYQWRSRLVRQAVPNAGHIALARLAALRPQLVVVTQNVDDLHERAGSTEVLHLHGSLFAPRCQGCARPFANATVLDADADADADASTSTSTSTSIDTGTAAPAARESVPPPDGTPHHEAALRIPPPQCPVCGDHIRPGVVWFGESLPAQVWRRAQALIEQCELLLVVGTSGIVQPAASLPLAARAAGAAVVEINPRSSALSDAVDLMWRETAARALPALVRALQRQAPP